MTTLRPGMYVRLTTGNPDYPYENRICVVDGLPNGQVRRYRGLSSGAVALKLCSKRDPSVITAKLLWEHESAFVALDRDVH